MEEGAPAGGERKRKRQTITNECASDEFEKENVTVRLQLWREKMKEVGLLQAKDTRQLAAYHDVMKRQRERDLKTKAKLHGKILELLRKLVVGSRTRTLALLWSILPNGLLARLLIDTQHICTTICATKHIRPTGGHTNAKATTVG
jgi:hypothetical protein